MYSAQLCQGTSCGTEFFMNETQLENLCLDWFAENGWEVVHGVDIAPDSSNPLRKDYKQILIEADLQTAF